MSNVIDEIILDRLSAGELYLKDNRNRYKGVEIKDPKLNGYYLTSDGEICDKDLPGHPLTTILEPNSMRNRVILYPRDSDCGQTYFLEDLIARSFFKATERNVNGEDVKVMYDPNKHGIIHRDGNMFNTHPDNLAIVNTADYKLYLGRILKELSENKPGFNVDIRTSSNNFSGKKLLNDVPLKTAAAYTATPPNVIYLMASRSAMHGIDIERSKFMFHPAGYTPSYQNGSKLNEMDYVIFDSKKKHAKRRNTLQDVAQLMSISVADLKPIITLHLNRLSRDMITTKNGNDNIELWLEEHFFAKYKDVPDIVYKDS